MNISELPFPPNGRIPDDLANVEATVVSVLFSNPENGWSVVRCKSKHGVRFTAVGPLLGVVEDDQLRLTGTWKKHPKYGEQLDVQSYVHEEPSTLEGMRRFLGSGRIRGIGPTMAKRIVKKFGLETLEVVENDPDRLREVKGVGSKTLKKIKESWVRHRGIQQIMVFLTGHGVAPGVAVKAHARYGASALEVVRSNPYRLAEEVHGVGFLTADRIGRNLGTPEDAPERLQAGLLYTLQQSATAGHVFLPRDEAQTAAAELLQIDPDGLDDALDALVARELVVVRARSGREPAVYPEQLEHAESSVVEHLRRILATPHEGPRIRLDGALKWYQDRERIKLADRQRAAVAAALAEKVIVVTGGPGTGKTTLIRGVTRILSEKGEQVLLAAPTGRAAKRLHEATGSEAKTIHRLLEFSPREQIFCRNAENPLDADVVVIDEVSMLDVELAAHLLAAIPPSSRLVMVGDADQLPSVGPGNVLADLISSGVVKVVRLDHIFRQADRSLIVDNAHRINHGEMPWTKAGDELQDFYFVHREDPTDAQTLAIEFITTRIPRRFGLDPVSDIQLLTPMHRGELGVTQLNQLLQTLLVPDTDELAIGARIYRVGDKVMQLRNNYDLDIFNGDIGRITAIDSDEREVVVSFDGRPVIIESADLDDLTLAYACTIHKSQGSEYPAVVILLHQQHYVMLQRNLLYTAVTRGRKLVVIVGTRRALARAVNNATVRQRYTMLAERLRIAD